MYYVIFETVQKLDIQISDIWNFCTIFEKIPIDETMFSNGFKEQNYKFLTPLMINTSYIVLIWNFCGPNTYVEKFQNPKQYFSKYLQVFNVTITIFLLDLTIPMYFGTCVIF
jgi:hypothetical protein